MRHTIIIITLFILFLSCSYSSNGQAFEKYEKFLTKNEKTNAHFFSAHAFISGVTNNNILKAGDGLFFGGGINPARLVSRKIVLGLFIDLRLPFIPEVNYHLSDDFRNTFKSSFNTTYNSHEDSVNAYSFKKQVMKNGLSDYYSSNWGIMFSPVPHKAGSFMVKYKKGVHTAAFYATEGLDVRVDLHVINEKFEISCRPFTFFKKFNKVDEMYFHRSPFHYIQFGVFYEKINLRKANIGEKHYKLENILSDSFFDKYGMGYNAGFTLGMAIF